MLEGATLRAPGDHEAGVGSVHHVVGHPDPFESIPEADPIEARVEVDRAEGVREPIQVFLKEGPSSAVQPDPLPDSVPEQEATVEDAHLGVRAGNKLAVQVEEDRLITGVLLGVVSGEGCRGHGEKGGEGFRLRRAVPCSGGEPGLWRGGVALARGLTVGNKAHRMQPKFRGWVMVCPAPSRLVRSPTPNPMDSPLPPPPAGTADRPVAFVLTTLPVPGRNWELSLYEENAGLLADADGCLREAVVRRLQPLLQLAERHGRPFRRQVTLEAVPHLLAFFPAEKTVRLGTPRLQHELFFLRHGPAGEAGDSGATEAFRAHARAMAEMPVEDFPSVLEEVSVAAGLPDPLEDERMGVLEEEEGKALLHRLVEGIHAYRPSWFERLSDFALGLTAEYALLRVHLLKFLALLPSLDHDRKGVEVKQRLLESLRRLLEDSRGARAAGIRGEEQGLPPRYTGPLALVRGLAGLLPAGVLAPLVRRSVRTMARRFIAGESIETASDSFQGLFRTGRDVTVDQLGELVVSETEADGYRDEVLRILRGFSLHVPKGARNGAGIPRAHVSIKVSALCADFRPEAFDHTHAQVAPRLRTLLLAAREEGVFLNIDAEHYHYRDIVFRVYRQVLLATPELRDFAGTGIVVQAYLRDAAGHLEEIAELARERGVCMPIRLVKGAYWDAETIEADAHGFNAPEFLNKEETDLHFRQLILATLERGKELQLCLASHNFADHAFAREAAARFFPEAPEIEHQCLHMTYEALSTALAAQGWPVRNYVPVGSLLVGMAYLVRRIMENSSQVGVLTIMRSHRELDQLRSPVDLHREKRSEGALVRDLSAASPTSGFLNVAPARLYREGERTAVAEAYRIFAEDGLGRVYDDAFAAPDGTLTTIVSSSAPETVVGRIPFGGEASARRALDTVAESFAAGDWAERPWQERALILQKAAHLLTFHRSRLAALVSYEAGKAVREALADVDEAIDFLQFYTREAENLYRAGPEAVARGPVAVIAPWNFPIAIPCGMSAAPLVAGNSVILKSAEQTPLVSEEMVRLFHRAGVPEGVFVHLPGTGEEVGQLLVRDERVAQYVFTGSMPVGTLIQREIQGRLIRHPRTGQTYGAQVITEMGGKNAILVTGNAELDETVAGILYSAFAHAGQKCSAASRVIVDRSIHPQLVERLREAVRDLEVGEAYRMATAVNPVITREDRDRLRAQVAAAAEEARRYGGAVLVDRSQEDLPGYCVGPAVLELPAERALQPDSIAQQELFGPVLHIVPVDSMEEGLRLFNATPYGLTGGIFSQSQDDIDRLTARMECGNIYVNRSITGARVGIEPFGGYKLSGSGPKAGGRDYLPRFVVQPFQEQVPGGEPSPGEDPGEDESITLAAGVDGPASARAAAMGRALGELLKRFDSLYAGLYGTRKEEVRSFREWIQRDFSGFVAARHWNRDIPGQLSFDDLRMHEEKMLVVALEKRPFLPSFFQVQAALLMGVGVTVAARNAAALAWWRQWADLLGQSGFPEASLRVVFPTGEALAAALADPLLSHVFVDGNTAQLAEVGRLNERALAGYEGHITDLRRVRHLGSPHDSPPAGAWGSFCRPFAEVRSFAVNTMRHGAPLELAGGEREAA